MPLSLTLPSWTVSFFRHRLLFRSSVTKQKTTLVYNKGPSPKKQKLPRLGRSRRMTPEEMKSIQIEMCSNAILLHFDAQVSIKTLLTDLEQVTASLCVQIRPSARSLFGIRLCFGERLLHPSFLRLVRRYIHEQTGLLVRGLSCSKDSMKQILRASIGLDIHENKEKSQIVHQTFRSGMMYSVEGELLVYGDVHEGAHIQSTGSITIMGVLSGTAHAGATGNRTSKIFASSMDTPSLWIDAQMITEKQVEHKRGYSVAQLKQQFTMGGT